MILFCLVHHFISWPTKDLSLLSRALLSQGRKMSGNNSEEGLSPDLTTGLVVSEAGLGEMSKLEKRTHISNGLLENCMWEESLRMPNTHNVLGIYSLTSVLRQNNSTFIPATSNSISKVTLLVMEESLSSWLASSNVLSSVGTPFIATILSPICSTPHLGTQRHETVIRCAHYQNQQEQIHSASPWRGVAQQLNSLPRHRRGKKLLPLCTKTLPGTASMCCVREVQSSCLHPPKDVTSASLPGLEML